MATTITVQASRSRYVKQSNPNTTYNDTKAVYEYKADRAFVQFALPASTYQYKRINWAQLHLYVDYKIPYADSSTWIHAFAYALSEAFGNNITYNTRKIPSGYAGSSNSPSVFKGSPGWVTVYWPTTGMTESKILKIIGLIKYGAEIGLAVDPSGSVLYDSTVDVYGASHAPYLDIQFDDTNAWKVISSVSPATGAYVPKYSANTFSWGVSNSGSCFGDLTVTSSKLQWKTSSSGTVTEINCGTNLSYTFPANTFTTGTVIWRAVITDSAGTTSTSDWQTLTTVEATPDAAVAVTPKNTMVDGSSAITFEWKHVISTGTAQKSAQLQYSTDGTTWSSLMNITGSATSTSISAGTFTSGQKYWRVRTANTDGTYGAYSEAAPFLVVSAPTAPNVSTNNKRRPTVSWQSDEQQGYEMEIVGEYSSGIKYGTANQSRLPIYLENGQYTARVRVVNIYGLWSEWGTAPLTVTTSGSGSLTLTGTSGEFNSLSWSGTDVSNQRFLVFRDGELIANITEKSFLDLEGAGTHSYYVRKIKTDDDNWNCVSNSVTLTAHCKYLYIIDMETRIVQKLEYTTTSIYSNSMNRSATTGYFHFSGAEYPDVELSEFSNKSVSFRTAFMNLEDAKAFEALFRRVVCIRTQKDGSVTGILTAISKTESNYYVGYNCTVQQIHRKAVEV